MPYAVNVVAPKVDPRLIEDGVCGRARQTTRFSVLSLLSPVEDSQAGRLVGAPLALGDVGADALGGGRGGRQTSEAGAEGVWPPQRETLPASTHRQKGARQGKRKQSQWSRVGHCVIVEGGGGEDGVCWCKNVGRSAGEVSERSRANKIPPKRPPAASASFKMLHELYNRSQPPRGERGVGDRLVPFSRTASPSRQKVTPPHHQTHVLLCRLWRPEEPWHRTGHPRRRRGGK